jgi:hypothetical protein
MTDHIGKTIILAGVFLVVIGVAFLFSDRIPFVGRLPGDIHIRRGNFQFYFPLATSIALSVVLTFLFWLFSHFGRR